MNGVTVYGNVLFLINFSMDFLLLFSTSKIMHLSIISGSSYISRKDLKTRASDSRISYLSVPSA